MFMELGIGIAAFGCIGAGALSKYIEFKRETTTEPQPRHPKKRPPADYEQMRNRAIQQENKSHRDCLEIFAELSEPEPESDFLLKLSDADG